MELRSADGPTTLRPGVEPVPGYRLVRRRGRGGFGEVWEAEAPGGTRVALKFVHGTPRARAAELRALDFIKGIRHPNLLANFASWQVRGTLIVGMELADGSLWDRYVRAADEGVSGIPRAELLGYMADSSAALDYLNEPRHVVDGRPGVGIQHRDVKPPNILLFGGGAKLADLGMARALEGDQAGHTGTWTFPYAAPEYFKGRTHHHSDQYGLAVTYCQLRSGRLPFEGGAASVTAGHLYGQPDLEGLPEAERPIVGRALAKEPGDRWPDCRSFVEALRALAGAEAPETLPRPPEPAEDVPRAPRLSTGREAVPPGFIGDFEDTPHSSWRDFDTGGHLDSLLHTGPPSEAVTAILPNPEAGPGAPTATGRLRFVRSAATILSVGLVIAASGVRPSGDRDKASRLAAQPVARPRSAEAVMPVVDPGPPAGPDAASPIEPRPASVEVEPPPAKAAVEIGPASPTVVFEPPEPPPTTRSDLVPAPRRVRVRPAPDPPEAATGPAPPSPEPDPVRLARVEGAQAEALGRELLEKGAFDRAIVELDRAVRLRPGAASAHFLRALARQHASHYPEALADYSEVIRLRPGDPIPRVARGQVHHDLGAYDRAIADFSGAIRLRPGDPAAYFRRGIARYRSEDDSGAIADLDETLRIDPKNRRAAEFRDAALARLGGRTRDVPAPRRPAPPTATTPPRRP